MLANGLAHREELFFPGDRQLVDPLDDDQLAALGPDDPIYTLEPRYRALRVAPYVLMHMVLLIALFLFTVLVPFPFFCGHNECSLSSYSIQIMLHVVTWIVSAILHHILHQFHLDSYVKGYAQLFHDTVLYRSTPFLVYSVGNVMLLIISVTTHEIVHTPSDVWSGVLPSVFFVPILVVLEMGLLLPLLFRYFLIIREFNCAHTPPDVVRNDLQLAGAAAAAAPSGGGRETCGQQLRFARQLLQRQADALYSLRSHNARLANLAHMQHERLEQLEVQCHQLRAAGGSSRDSGLLSCQ